MAPSLRTRGGTEAHARRALGLMADVSIYYFMLRLVQVCDETAGRSGLLCVCGAEQRPGRSVCGHFHTQPRETEAHEGAEHPRPGQTASSLFVLLSF